MIVSNTITSKTSEIQNYSKDSSTAKKQSKHSKQATWGLPILYKYAKMLGVGSPKFSDNMTMKESKELFEKKILEEVHKYAIFEVPSVPGQWKTTLPDPSRPDGRRHIKRQGYDRLCQAVIEYYLEQMHLDMTMDALFDRWLIFRRDETASQPGTLRKYKSLYVTHCQNLTIDGITLGNWKITELTHNKIKSFFRKLTKNRTYTYHMVKDIRIVLNGILNYAVEQEIIPINPVRGINLKQFPYKPEKPKQNDVFSKTDTQKLLSYLESLADDPFVLAIRLFFNLFVRIGEIAGLMWEDVDIENRRINICHKITYEPKLNDDLTFSDKEMITEDYLKGCTSDGYRDEYITDEALDILKRAKRINPDGKYVFMPFGKPIINLTFNKRLKKYCLEAGVTYHSSHKIRFYACSTAYKENKENLVQISKMMGHSQVSTTLRYLRDVDQDQENATIFNCLGRQPD